MTTRPRGVVAAGHPQTAEAGAGVLRAGGNAVDAAVAAMLASFATEPVLTGLGAGGYMLVHTPAGEQVLLDFFVEAPGRGMDGPSAELVPIEVDFGDAEQIFHIGPASCGAYGNAAGVCEAAARFGTLAMSDLVAPAVALAREGAVMTAAQAYIIEILMPIIASTPECSALLAPEGRPPREGERLRNPDLADALERLGRDGAAPFYTGDVAAAVSDWVTERGGILGRADLAAYEVVPRAPVRVRYRDREVLTNPPPSAGGTLIAYALTLLDRDPGPPTLTRVVAAMAGANAERTPEFLAGLAEPGFADRFLASRLGSTTHIAVVDADGWACSVTCSNGACSGVVVPGTGIHVNNMLGEQDLNPLGFHRHPPGRRMPSMMAPTIVLRDGEPELVLGSAGSNRIRSAILQTIVGVVDNGLAAGPAVEAPRVHFEAGVVWAEPGIPEEALAAVGYPVRRFRSLNVYFGGVQAAERRPDTGALSGGGDPRRGGVAVVV
jgi:gamma-glutamyltranspeptidase / glutathione hydrolase